MRLTRQGIPDLNYYGPKRRPPANVAAKSAEDVAIAATPPAAQELATEQPSDQEKPQPESGL